MFISFGAVLLITVTQSSTHEEDEGSETMMFGDNLAMARLTGCLCVLA